MIELVRWYIDEGTARAPGTLSPDDRGLPGMRFAEIRCSRCGSQWSTSAPTHYLNGDWPCTRGCERKTKRRPARPRRAGVKGGTNG
jgi:hypothetical protein